MGATVARAGANSSLRLRQAGFVLLWVFVVLLGLRLSWGSGFSVDDYFERETTDTIFGTVADFVGGADPSFSGINAFSNRYYGIGFHALSYPFRALLAPAIEHYQGLAPADAILAAEHVAVFLFFLLGGWCVFRTLLLCGVERGFAALAALFFIANPYLFGHGTMNTKDAPFMVAWLLCTWRMLVPCMRLLTDGTVRRADFFWLGVSTALLLSIRISGMLIAVQYLATLVALGICAPDRLRAQLRRIMEGAVILGTTAGLLVWAAYPVFWLQPWELVRAMRYMGNHPWGGCSMTWGRCMSAQDLPWTYVPAWLLVKTSVVGLAGFALAIFALTRPAPDPRQRFALRVLVLSPAAILAVVILAQANLYNEIRQVLFLVSLVYLAAFVAWARHPRIARPLFLGGIAIAIADLAMSYPYAYVWFNEAARLSDVDTHFETDYWGLSSREIAAELGKTQLSPTQCAFVLYPHQMQPFLPAGPCLEEFDALTDDEPRPFLLSVIPHGGQEKYEADSSCAPIYVVRRRLLGALAPLTIASLRLCR